MTCPVCGGIPAGAQVWVHCPRVQDAICMAHCLSLIHISDLKYYPGAPVAP